MSTSVQRRDEPSPVAQAAIQTGAVVNSMRDKLLGARLKAPVRLGKGERDVFEAPVRVHAGMDGVSNALAHVDAKNIKAPESTAGKALLGAKSLGKVLIGVGAALDVMDIGRSINRDRVRGDGKMTETKKAGGRIAGGWGGAIAGAKIGAKVGAVLPFGGPVAGMVVGSLVGGISGHIAGDKLMS